VNSELIWQPVHQCVATLDKIHIFPPKNYFPPKIHLTLITNVKAKIQIHMTRRKQQIKPMLISILAFLLKCHFKIAHVNLFPTQILIQ